MFNYSKIYTTESVSSGHPDKVCDQISDAILDRCLEIDPKSRVAVETFGGHGLLVISGEITSKAEVDFEQIARRVYSDIGYLDNLKVIVNISKQSSDISQGVDTGGAGDQGIMYGYATNETKEFLPTVIVLAHKITKGLEWLRKTNQVDWLKPDGKSQVTMKGNRVQTILISTQHSGGVEQEEIRQTLIDKLINLLFVRTDGIEILINPTGQFIQGGFEADTGLTGRKIMVDTYGGLMPHGGGAFSGKDPTKVDRSGAYMCGFVAKNLVARGLAKECLVSVAYAIGRDKPLMISAINENGESLDQHLIDKFDFRPMAIIERLDLQKPIYQQTACYGHFGRADLPWEKIEE